MSYRDGPIFRILSTCKGGGYQYARTDPGHPRANSKGLYPLHRVLMENKLGRMLEASEHVHHIDGDRNNNDPANLEVMTPSDHARHHALIDNVEATCGTCGRAVSLKPHTMRLRMGRNKSRKIACSRVCGARLGRSDRKT